MAVQSLQYNSFLGGEVSPRLQYRTDMDKFGKWFKTAENIRFHTIGSFENRPGFAKVADTKRNIAGEVIKLLHFSFNDEESFLLEFGKYNDLNDKGYVRFYKDKKQITVKDSEENDIPYELESPLKISNENEIKYIQSGDVLFITDCVNPIYELRRLKKDGTEWEFKKFEFKDDCYPLDEENTDESKILSFIKHSPDQKQVEYSFSFTFDEVHKDYFFLSNPRVTMWINDDHSQTPFTSTSTYNNLEELCVWLRTLDWQTYAEGTVEVSSFGRTLQIIYKGTKEFKKWSITSGYVSNSQNLRECSYHSMDIDEDGWKNNVRYYPDQFFVPTELEINETPVVGLEKRLVLTREEVRDVTKNADSYWALWGNKLANYYGIPYYYSHNDRVNDSTFCTRREDGSRIFNVWNPISARRYTRARNIYGINRYYLLYGLTYGNFPVDARANPYGDNINPKYLSQSVGHNFYENKEIGDVFCLRKILSSSSYSGKQSITSEAFYTPELIGTGSWRLWTSGNWAGEFRLEYSVDNGATWVTFYDFHCNDQKMPKNPNAAGEIDGVNGTCLIRARIQETAVDTYHMDFELEHKGGEVNVYYKLIDKLSSNQAIVECVKNDVGIVSSSYWRESILNGNEWNVNSLGFYQNRLFFGKDYQLYGSKTNDFWDFYEPIEIADDDPVVMSLLSYRVNNIKNIVTIRSFFAFTQGGEFGISAEGALTQANKYLKQFSTHGSAECLPIVVGSVVLFVEKSTNKVRALQYSFESDNYEAEDVSVLIEDLLEKQNIISTEYLNNTHEVLFLSEQGIIWCFKFYPEQNIYSWSHWKHAKGKITNICVVPRGSEEDLYLAVDTDYGKQIEVFDREIYADSIEQIEELSNVIQTKYNNANFKIFNFDKKEVMTIKSDDNGQITLPEYEGVCDKLYAWYREGTGYRYTKSENPKIGDKFYFLEGNSYREFGEIQDVIEDSITKQKFIKIEEAFYQGYIGRELSKEHDIMATKCYICNAYISTATLLSPEITSQDSNNSVYYKKRPFKVHYVYKNSYGFKIGVEDNEKMNSEWQKFDEVIDNERELTSGKKAILVPARYDGTSRVSFVQDEPYPMIVENINIEVDYGGK